jgi:MFS transporter, SP family, sugar:H+ symporter
LLNRYGVFILFAGLIVIMSIFIFLLLPETKQVPIEEISQLFEKHWYWKKIVSKDSRFSHQNRNNDKYVSADA